MADNFGELGRFLERWKRRKRKLNLPYTGSIALRAAVVYKTPQQTLIDTTRVLFRLMAGPTDGTVELDETKRLRVRKIHLSFSPDLQRYRYSKTKRTFRIKGESKKLGGEYSVVITPIELWSE